MYNICSIPDQPMILVADTDPIPDGYTLEGTTANPNYLTDSQTAASNRHVTVLAFRNRFTVEEKIAIDIASIDNPTASLQTRSLQASLRVYQKDLDNATYVDLERADTQSGVTKLEQYGVIGTGRASEILNAPIQPIERPTAHDNLAE